MGGGDEREEQKADLPDAVRQRVVGAAAALVGSLPPAEVPATLRRIAQFAPARRARVGAAAIMEALESDVVLRQRTGEAISATSPELAAGVRAGDVPPDADPVEVAAFAYLLRPDGWPTLVVRLQITSRRGRPRRRRCGAR